LSKSSRQNQPSAADSGRAFEIKQLERAPDILVVTIKDLRVWVAEDSNSRHGAFAFAYGTNVFCAYMPAMRALTRSYGSSTALGRLAARAAADGARLCNSADNFRRALFDHLNVAVRGLSDGYDIVQESYDYVEILQHIGEQLRVVIENDWSSVDAMRDALRGLTGFIVERFIKLTSVPWQKRREETLQALMTRVLQSKFSAI